MKILLSLGILVFGVVVGHYLWPRGNDWDGENKAKYVLVFGNGAGGRVKIQKKKRPDFIDAINHQARWNWDLNISADGSDPAKKFTNQLVDDLTAKKTSRARIIQLEDTKNTCTQHVTQKLGLDSEDQVKAILATLDTKQAP